MSEHPANSRQSPSWLGPVFGALILLGGYVGYQEWKERDTHTQTCARLKRAFQSNMDAMMGPAEDAIAEAKKEGNLLPMGSLSDSVAANKLVLNQLNTDCPGWMTAQND